MSKTVIRPNQFAKVDVAMLAVHDDLALNQAQIDELSQLYGEALNSLKSGKLVTGRIIRIDSDGVLVNIEYKSDGLISRQEFSEHELKQLKVGDPIEVILDNLENAQGNVILSYEKAKAVKAWDAITKLFEENKPVEGVVTHKVKGGLNVDIGIPAFLPGSQIDLHRVLDFDQYVGQTIVANILKINKKRGNVIISRRKYLSEMRSEERKKILDTLTEGQIIQGVVKNITNYGVFIDIGGVDGLLHITDMTWGRISHPSELVHIGDTISVKVLSFDKTNEKISLGLKQLSDNPWKKVSETLKEGSRIKGRISSITDYGLFVEVEKGVEGLIHISEISWTERISDLSKRFHVGQEIEALVVSFDKDNRRMSLSIKQLNKNPWESLHEQFAVGQKIKGAISNITDFGIFIQILPGIDGLVHISDLSWTEHIDHPSDMFKKGDEVEAIILNIDKDNKKISLGIKQLTEDPWELIEKQYPVGAIIEGEVSKITNFGAFIKLASGVEGLVHISELSNETVDKVEDILKVGQKTQFRVINVNKNDRKLGLSLKLTPSQPKEEKEHAAPKTQAAPKKQAARKEVPQQPVQPKTKSQFQLELEKHTSRPRQDDETTSEE
ncbi:MAG TPA: 30S ribosomal protein S1 [Candidatus Babeliales bacterium]|nr:30S ribosomal protein S1 [Candidatus Babeliales bacterium]